MELSMYCDKLRRIYNYTLCNTIGGVVASKIYGKEDANIIGKTVSIIYRDSFTNKINKEKSLFGGIIISKNSEYTHSMYMVKWFYTHDDLVKVYNNTYGNYEGVVAIDGNVSTEHIDRLYIVSLEQAAIETIKEGGLFYFLLIIGFVVFFIYCISMGIWKDIVTFFK